MKANILLKEQMQELGFTNYLPPYWCISKSVIFPKEKRYRGFHVLIIFKASTETGDVRIDALDEDFCQPYDYEYILAQNPDFPPALIVKNSVEELINYLKDKNIIAEE